MTECKTCGSEITGKAVQYRCDCGDDCSCGIIEFESEPDSVPHCCGTQMKRIK
jgi:hypothetical protein